jgi:hypothetical protein
MKEPAVLLQAIREGLGMLTWANRMHHYLAVSLSLAAALAIALDGEALLFVVIAGIIAVLILDLITSRSTVNNLSSP